MREGAIFGRRPLTVVANLVIALSAAGCGGYSNRVDVDKDTDVDNSNSSYSSQDIRTVSQKMARSIMQVKGVVNSPSPPRIAFLAIENRSNELIDTDMFLEKIRTLLIKNGEGRLRFLDRAKVEDILSERAAKRAGVVTHGKHGDLGGADYFLTGSVSSLDRVAGKGKTTFMRFSFRLTGAETSDIIWEDEYEIKKTSGRAAWD